MDCEMNKPKCKRKAAMEHGAFKMKDSCPGTKPPKCPVSKKQCPLLPPAKDDCPISRLLGRSIGRCPLAQDGCPCDPNPPCPLEIDYDSEDEVIKNMNEFINKVMAEHKAKRKHKKKKRSLPMEEEMLKNITLNLGDKPPEISSSSSSETSSDTSSVASTDSGDIIFQKAIIEDDKPTLHLTISKIGQKKSSKQAFCDKCVVGQMKKKEEKRRKNEDIDEKKDVPCSFLKIETFCNNICPCDEIEPINTGPACPFEPKPCSCCVPPKCPMIKDPECPIPPPKPTCCCPQKCALSSPKCRCLPSSCPYANDAPPCNCSSPPPPCAPKPPCAPRSPCAPCPPPPCFSKCTCK